MSNPDSPLQATDSHTDTVAERVQAALGDACRIDRELGGGGMSRVFFAHVTSLDRDVVVKVLPEDVAEGQSLRAKLTADGAMSVPHTVSILRDVARALAFAHERGVVHRDIKPDNVLLAGGAAIVADFGVAKAVARRARARSIRTAPSPMPAFRWGHPLTWHRKQVAGDPMVDHRADLYALGVMAYEMLAGYAPFAGRGVTEIMQAHLIEVPVPL